MVNDLSPTLQLLALCQNLNPISLPVLILLTWKMSVFFKAPIMLRLSRFVFGPFLNIFLCDPKD